MPENKTLKFIFAGLTILNIALVLLFTGGISALQFWGNQTNFLAIGGISFLLFVIAPWVLVKAANWAIKNEKIAFRMFFMVLACLLSASPTIGFLAVRLHHNANTDIPIKPPENLQQQKE